MPHSVIDLRVGGSHSAAYRHVYTFRFSCSSISFRFQLNCFLFFLLCLVSWFFFSFSLLRVHSVCTHFLILHSFRPFQSSFWTSSPSGFPLCVYEQKKKRNRWQRLCSLCCAFTPGYLDTGFTGFCFYCCGIFALMAFAPFFCLMDVNGCQIEIFFSFFSSLIQLNCNT